MLCDGRGAAREMPRPLRGAGGVRFWSCDAEARTEIPNADEDVIGPAGRRRGSHDSGALDSALLVLVASAVAHTAGPDARLRVGLGPYALLHRPQERPLLAEDEALRLGFGEVGQAGGVFAQALAIDLEGGQALKRDHGQGDLVGPLVRHEIAQQVAAAGGD